MSVLCDFHDDAASSAAGSIVGGFAASSCTSSSSTYKPRKSGDFSAFTAPPGYRNSGAFVHGTKFKNFKPIMEQGLKVVKTEIFMIDEVRSDGRVPGLKDPPEILIFIDEQKARSHNMEFDYDTKEGSWRTKGINGVIRPWFFQKVVDQRRGPGRGNVLFQSKQDPMMFANMIRGEQRPKYLVHATYWENVAGIMREGLVPAKNPTSESRRAFKELLQGAEQHVYTLKASAMPEPEFRRAVSDEPPGSPSAAQESRRSSVRRPTAYTLDSERYGLEKPPDAFFVIDTEKAQEMGVKLGMVQSAECEDLVYVQGPVPRELLRSPVPNYPVELPESLRAAIVNPESFEDIPIIDISGDEEKVVEQMRYACEIVGFMQVTGHGVSTELQERAMDLHKRFFALPSEVKKRLELCEESPVRGYFGRGGEDLDQVLDKEVDAAEGQKIKKQSRKDKKEALDTNGVPWSRPAGGYVANIFGMPSVLPEEEELPGFRAAMEEYATEMFRLSRRLLSIMARVLGHPADFFERHLTAPVATHRLLHYWPIEDFRNEIGVGEHTDYGLLTVLRQDSVGGLQVLNAKDGKWIHCCPIDNAFVVNLGDMLARWTDHQFKSTVHRVVPTSGVERFSVPYFLEPNMDTQIALGGILKREAGSEAAVDTAEDILERFYRASGQLKFGADSQAKAAAASTPVAETPPAPDGHAKFVPPPRGFSQ